MYINAANKTHNKTGFDEAWYYFPGRTKYAITPMLSMFGEVSARTTARDFECFHEFVKLPLVSIELMEMSEAVAKRWVYYHLSAFGSGLRILSWRP